MTDLVTLGFETDAGFGERARIGLIVLQSDLTIEAEARMLGIDGVSFYHSRIPNDAEVTPETLQAMEARLPVAASLLSADFGFDAIGYGCTSAATLIGEDRVAGAIQQVHPGMACSNPISAAVEAFRSLGSSRIAVVTPYTADVTAPIAEHFGAAGFDVVAVGSFLESRDLVVASISERSIADAVRTVAGSVDCDAVFISCTSLRTMGIVAELEADLNVPVVSSNIALFWHLLRLAGIADTIGPGRLFATHLVD